MRLALYATTTTGFCCVVHCPPGVSNCGNNATKYMAASAVESEPCGSLPLHPRFFPTRVEILLQAGRQCPSNGSWIFNTMQEMVESSRCLSLNLPNPLCDTPWRVPDCRPSPAPLDVDKRMTSVGLWMTSSGQSEPSASQ